MWYWWTIVGREKGKGEFKPFNGQGFSRTIDVAWDGYDAKKVREIVAHLNEDNPSYEFRPMPAYYGQLTRDPDKPIAYNREDMDRFLAANPQYTEDMVISQEHAQELFRRWMNCMPEMGGEPNPGKVYDLNKRPSSSSQVRRARRC